MTSFVVPGKPRSQGSLSPFAHPVTRKIVTRQDPKVLEYRHAVAWAAREAGVRCTDEPVTVQIVARWARPKSHYRTNGELRSKVPRHRTSAPDVDKVARAVCDGLEGVAYYSDAQVVGLEILKAWAVESSTTVTVQTITDEDAP